ncbi:hypothetical protein O181_022056 [Austropuccinia psidii MF-1]|uniref:Uncharacterized protein n=1 Tax=Austropuccinia psidii MF-1 TaxID=1389203 RepID=A0A9Q3CC47_9BASI|nr:hypothetical protein [Austropuccinia psidii MF-1]
MNETFYYEKQKWEKSHKVPYFKLGDLVLVLNLNFNNIRGPNKIINCHVVPFIIFVLHGTNEVAMELSGELENKHPTFPVSLIIRYPPAIKELVPSRNPTALPVLQAEHNGDKKTNKEITERRLRVKTQKDYLVT